MEPIPETVRAVEELDDLAEGDLLQQLRTMAAIVQETVPDCIGISLAWHDHGLTFTLVATEQEIAVLDAVQYLAGGPCVSALHEGAVVETTEEDLFSEENWRMFARASAAATVASTLTLPILQADKVIGTVNLYGASGNAFAGHHEQVARVFGAWAPGAVANADLSFSTRREAEQAPLRLEEESVISRAIGVLAAASEVDLTKARGMLREAALRAGISEAQLAAAVLDLRTE